MLLHIRRRSGAFRKAIDTIESVFVHSSLVCIVGKNPPLIPRELDSLDHLIWPFQVLMPRLRYGSFDGFEHIACPAGKKPGITMLTPEYDDTVVGEYDQSFWLLLA